MQRGAEMAKEERISENREQIQLVAENDSTVISFHVPDGPPPEHITLEGEGTEDLDIETVRATLVRRWEIFEAFPKNLKKALRSNELAAVNRVLGAMSVDQAEEIVQQLDEAAILNFSTSEIIDKTGETTQPAS